MARMVGRLNTLAVERLGAGLHGDGGGLYLRVAAGGARSWVYRFMLHGRAREMGLGPLHTVGLAEARRRAAEARLLRLDGVDPIAQRHGARQAGALAAAKAITFREAARQYILANKVEWKNPKHAAQWGRTLETYAYPVFGAVAVGAVETGLVLRALEPIWQAKPETASRVRGRIEAVLAWAAARGYRERDNPAGWKGHLDQILPRLSKAKRAKRAAGGRAAHHAALPYPEAGAFLAALRQQPGIAARALEFGILTATRTAEFLGARWGEIDLDNAVWVIAAARMKAGREHRVPLSTAAVAALRGAGPGAGPGDGDEFVFAAEGSAGGRPLSNMACLMLLRRMAKTAPAYAELTVHGFRSTFRDWAGDRTGFERDLIELALAHALADKTEAAYRRSDGFDKRRRLMQAWAEYCDRPGDAAGAVVPLQRRAG